MTEERLVEEIVEAITRERIAEWRARRCANFQLLPIIRRALLEEHDAACLKCRQYLRFLKGKTVASVSLYGRCSRGRELESSQKP